MGAIKVFKKRFNPCIMIYFLTRGSLTSEEERDRSSPARTIPPWLNSLDSATLHKADRPSYS